MNPLVQEVHTKDLEVVDGRWVVKCRSRCSARENVREQDGHVWLGLGVDGTMELRIWGEDIWFDLLEFTDAVLEWPPKFCMLIGEAAIADATDADG